MDDMNKGLEEQFLKAFEEFDKDAPKKEPTPLFDLESEIKKSLENSFSNSKPTDDDFNSDETKEEVTPEVEVNDVEPVTEKEEVPTFIIRSEDEKMEDPIANLEKEFEDIKSTSDDTPSDNQDVKFDIPELEEITSSNVNIEDMPNMEPVVPTVSFETPVEESEKEAAIFNVDLDEKEPASFLNDSKEREHEFDVSFELDAKELENLDASETKTETVDDLKRDDIQGVPTEQVSEMLNDVDKDEPAAFKGAKLEFDEVSDDETKVEKPRRNRNQPTAEDIQKENTRFWIFTAVVSVIVIVAVVFILFSRGIITLPENTEEPTTEISSETETEMESLESSEESESESESVDENDKSSVVSHYENLFVVAKEGKANVRESASTDSAVIATIEQFGGGEVLEQKGDWYHISSGGYDGYISVSLVVTGENAKQLALEHAEKRVIVNCDTLIMRSEASKESTEVTAVKKKNNLEYLGEEGNFYKVRYDEDEGYVSKDFSILGYYLREAMTHYSE